MAPVPGILRAGDLDIDVGAHYVCRNGRRVPLRQQTMKVLLYLVEHRVRIVSKDELLAHAWGDVAVTEDVLTQCIKEIRKALKDDHRAPLFIRTVPKVGYQFMAPVETASGTVEATVSKAADVRRLTASRWWLIGLSSAVLVLSVAAWRWQTRTADSTPGAPRVGGTRGVLVSRLTNRSGRTDLDWLCEGIRDMLVTDLARSPGLSLVAPQQISSAVRRSGWNDSEPMALDRAIEVANTFGADAAVVGSVFTAGAALRVDVQAYEVPGGRLIVADRINVDRVDDLFQAVDLLSLRLIERLGVAAGGNVHASETASVMTGNIEAYRAYALGLELANSLHHEAAIEHFKRAIATDPDFAMAHARIGYTYVMALAHAEEAKPFLSEALRRGTRLTARDRDLIQAWYATANEDFGAAIEMYRKALQADPRDDESYWRLGHLLAGEERFAEAIATFERGLSVNPRSVDLLNDLCIVLSDVGRHAEAIAACARAAAVAPTEANVADSLGLAYQAAGDVDRATEAYTTAIRLDPTYEVAFAHRGNVSFQRGRYRRASDDYQQFLERGPDSDAHRQRSYENLAWIAHRGGDHEKALELTGRAEPLWRPAQVGVLFAPMVAVTGDAALRKRYDELVAITAALARGGRLSQRLICYARGTAALAARQHEDALRWFRQLLTHRPITWNIEPLEDALANALLDLGRVDEAIAEYRRVTARTPSLSLARYKLARAHDRAGDRAEARREFSAFLQAWKDADRDVPEYVAAAAWLAAHP